ncbi:lanthionine synthetase LanC family protein [Serinicoccus kebangsaanensis]|uniref:lanthionine synthetase LanC family protein n=1 Tax=Serinicoccus kebangsaanensis TaxID=2602069 RepID=UPI00178C3252|nr:lanthionine synthetase LanC family protein [Serinicoccus kebangsaanensis]
MSTVASTEAPTPAPGASASVRALADRAAGTVLARALRQGDRVGWAAWHRLDGTAPATLRLGGAEVYDGDAGIGWALGVLSPVLDRPELHELARRAVAGAGPTVQAPGLLDGRAGVAVARAAVTGAGDPSRLPAADDVSGTDLLDGLSGVLLAALSLGAAPRVTDELVRALLDRGSAQREGWCYPGPPDAGGVPLAPLTGLAHGSSGVLLALGHWLATDPGTALAARVRERFRATWLWETAWSDPVLGWPDLREEPPAYPVMWCHGAAGIAATRIELGRLCEAGVDLGVPGPALRAQAEAGVRLCRDFVSHCAEQARHQQDTLGATPVQVDPADAGLTLCHGLGGALDVLASAAVCWGVDEHLELARASVLDLVDASGDDPDLWPTGQRTRGGYGLFQGLSGTAVVLARLAHPEAGLPSPGMFGVPVRLP